jgi:hypothetical protein
MKVVIVIEVDEEKLEDFFNGLATVTGILSRAGKVKISMPNEVEIHETSITADPAQTQTESEVQRLEKEIAELPQDFLKEQAAKLKKQREKRQDEADAEIGGLAGLQSRIGKIPSQEKRSEQK